MRQIRPAASPQHLHSPGCSALASEHVAHVCFWSEVLSLTGISFLLGVLLNYPSGGTPAASKVCVCSQLRPDVLLLSRRRDASCEQAQQAYCRVPSLLTTIFGLAALSPTALLQASRRVQISAADNGARWSTPSARLVGSAAPRFGTDCVTARRSTTASPRGSYGCHGHGCTGERRRCAIIMLYHGMLNPPSPHPTHAFAHPSVCFQPFPTTFHRDSEARDKWCLHWGVMKWVWPPWQLSERSHVPMHATALEHGVAANGAGKRTPFAQAAAWSELEEGEIAPCGRCGVDTALLQSVRR